MKDSIANTFKVAPRPRKDEVRTGVSAIRWWTLGGVVFVGLDVLAWFTDDPVVGVILAPFGLLLLGGALQGWRTNLWLERAKVWNTHQRHEFPEHTER